MNILKKGKDDMATFYHNNGSVEFIREDAKLWYTDSSFKFLCKMIFKNNPCYYTTFCQKIQWINKTTTK